MRSGHGAQAVAAVSLLLLGGAGAAAEPPAATPGAGVATPASGEAQVSEVKGGFLASLKQAFEQDPEREVVLGHFDVGKPTDTHRFYCLVDPKTGKKEPNAVGGKPVRRRDGMTGITGPAVSPLSCADAEQKGLLITSGYVLKGVAARPASAGAGPAEKPAGAPPAAG
ncbi:MAG TPA: hypothetical protein VFK87_07445, partial [Steroidobacteraceae bacterium]|nr:hypothetical protein [Steroidobacteraceae bacterium]